MVQSVNKRDYYDVLGLERDATPEQIKKAYRRAAHKYHPDRNQDADAEEMFKEAAESYEVLSDPAKRARYDQYGHAGLGGAGVHDYSHMHAEDIFSMFNDIFGGRKRSRRGGADLQTEVEISLAEAAEGVERSLEFARNEFCENCGGNGAAPGSKRETCATCGGYGQVEQSTGFGAIFGRVVTTCPNCQGRGSNVSTPCTQCRGSGRQQKERMVTVQIPPGIHDGQAVRVRGEGEPGEDGHRGDLHCYVRVGQHPFLERHRNDLLCRLPISFTQAALGAQIEVPTLTGKAEIKVPAGTQHGQLVRLAGLGMPDLRTGRRGDQLMQVFVEIPKHLDRAQEELLRKFADTEDKSVLPESKGFFDKLRDYFGSLS